MKNIEVVAAIIIKENRIFATQRGYGDFKGWWEFPGGKIEKGESHIDALKREIHEELNADIKVEDLLAVVEHDYADFHLKMNCYISKLKSNELELLEHSDAKWLNIDSIDDVNWLPADIKVVDEIKEQKIIDSV